MQLPARIATATAVAVLGLGAAPAIVLAAPAAQQVDVDQCGGHIYDRVGLRGAVYNGVRCPASSRTASSRPTGSASRSSWATPSAASALTSPRPI
ncbi:hypothetical protein [Actinomadura terrae]|uniref:hypothetical protein n=1 Tax=Actinomadura terrae TaxID=604353 RepID=UPI001FA7EBCC|nr:hypothetical protein [Actinomadura terrae]